MEQYIPNFIKEGSDFTRNYIEEISRQYSIEPVVSTIQGRFPYIDNNREYRIEISNIEYLRYGLGHSGYADIIVRQNFHPFYYKTVGKARIGVIRNMNESANLLNRIELYYVKGPFENRIAIIIKAPNDIDGDYYYLFSIKGCHLEVGFLQDSN